MKAWIIKRIDNGLLDVALILMWLLIATFWSENDLTTIFVSGMCVGLYFSSLTKEQKS